MKSNRKAILLVLDGFGVGETEDASSFGDSGAYTSRHILRHVPDIQAPFLLSHGLLAYDHSDRILPLNPNKDTLSGLYELMGMVYPRLPVFPHGFSQQDIAAIETLTSRKIIGNIPQSGTVILEKLGEDHLKSGHLIVYTSSDSVFQIAAHQELVSIGLLYFYCTMVRAYFDPLLPLGRVIARPFLGQDAATFYRTPWRKDFPYIPSSNHLLHRIRDLGVSIRGNHVIDHIFPGFIDQDIKGKTDIECMEDLLLQFSATDDTPVFYFLDLEELDMIYGHRRDPLGYAGALQKLDSFFHQLAALLSPEDILIITADHGNDPTFSHHTNHTREHVPYLVLHGSGQKESHGLIKGMSWISQRIESFFSS